MSQLDERRARRQAWSPWSHLAALALGAAAAAALLAARSDREAESAHGDPAGVPLLPSASSSAKVIELDAPCADCCAGSACAGAGAGLEHCPSGTPCASCNVSSLTDSLYRLRVGAVGPSELGLDVLKLYPQGEPELCVRAGVAREQCMPAQITAREGAFTLVPGVFAGADLAAKVSIRLRWKGVAREALATAGRWVMPLALTPKALCVGYAVDLKDDADQIFGTTSLFIDDAQHVEIMRAEATAPLRDMRSRLLLRGPEVVLRESESEGARHFVLSVGPLNKKAAEALRWQLLEQSVSAQITDGLDYRGAPLPLP